MIGQESEVTGKDYHYVELADLITTQLFEKH
jgi:hypothetical protein